MLKTTSPVNGKIYEANDTEDLVNQLKADGHENIVLTTVPVKATVFQVEGLTQELDVL